MSEKIKIAVVDDHQLFRGGLIELVHNVSDRFEVIMEAGNGEELLEKLEKKDHPDIALIDINMKGMNGYKTVEKLQESYPEIQILVVTMNEDEDSLIRMVKLGASGYINKDVEKKELRLAIENLKNKGFHYNDKVTGQLIRSIRFPGELDKTNQLSERETEFVKLACSEDTYEQIADKMFLSVKTIDGYRASVFEKLNAKSRVGMVMQAIKKGMVDL